jgi:hypothetical protein
MYNFKRLVKEYGKVKPFKIVETDGYYDYDNGGVWVDGGPGKIEIDGAVVPINENVIKDNQAYTSEDKELYTYESLEPNTKVEHKEIEYTIMERQDFTDFDEGLNIYTLKRGGK